VRPHLNRERLGLVVYAYHPSDGRKHEIRWWSRLAWAKSKTPISKISRAERAGVVAQVVERPEFKPQYCQNLKTKIKTDPRRHLNLDRLFLIRSRMFAEPE
jgi:hypothetical protein